MNKKLVKSFDEFVKFLLSLKYNPAKLEGMLGLDFVNANGQTFTEYEEACEASGTIPDEFVETNIRTSENSHVPAQYPCLILFSLEKDFDRVGTVETKFLDFIYLEDFGLPQSIQVSPMQSFPPNSNPFWHDAFNMGHYLGKNAIAMFGNFEKDRCDYLNIINIVTGERLHVRFNDGK